MPEITILPKRSTNPKRSAKTLARPALVLLWLTTAGTAMPQEADPVVLRADSRAVQLSVMVEDATGKAIRGLGKDDFVILDNGKGRPIKIFEENRSLPAVPIAPDATSSNSTFSNAPNLSPPPPGSTIIAIDTSAGALMGTVGSRTEVVKVCDADDYVVCEVSPRTRSPQLAGPVAVYAICPELRLLQDFTSDRSRILSALQSFEPSTKPGEETCPAAQVFSSFQAIAGYLSASASRTSLLWLTSGNKSETLETELEPAFDSAIVALNNADVALYAADVSCVGRGLKSSCEGSGQLLDSARYSQWVQDLVHATGGAGVYISSATPAGSTVLGSMLDLAQSGFAYRLGFYLSDADLDGTFHRMRVTLPGRPKLVVNGRRGYTASANSVFPGGGKELAREFARNAIGFRAGVSMSADSTIRLDLSVDLATVSGTADNPVLLDETVREFDGDGKQLARFQQGLQLQPSMGATAASNGQSVALSKGAQWVAILVRDNRSGHTGSMTIPIR